jgi:hypothetical protein
MLLDEWENGQSEPADALEHAQQHRTEALAELHALEHGQESEAAALESEPYALEHAARACAETEAEAVLPVAPAETPKPHALEHAPEAGSDPSLGMPFAWWLAMIVPALHDNAKGGTRQRGPIEAKASPMPQPAHGRASSL